MRDDKIEEIYELVFNRYMSAKDRCERCALRHWEPGLISDETPGFSAVKLLSLVPSAVLNMPFYLLIECLRLSVQRHAGQS